ncbi:TRAP transporter small permease [Hyphomicrobiales bacterium]|nr:TRAP transporter small permease [Hyphomicrobiales bacterium]CAH1674952.1 TRAP transporter small permease [Hyphomicrobiales bacterium]
MQKFLDLLYRALDLLLVVLLAGMVALVFANAVARYVFDYSIHVADELPRFMFVWLTFIGAAVAHRQSLHLGMKFVITSFPKSAWPGLMALSEVLILGCCLLLIWGGVLTWQVNASVTSPILGASLVYVHGVAVFSAVLMAMSSTWRLVRLARGEMTEHELAVFAETEEDQVIAETKGRLD